MDRGYNVYTAPDGCVGTEEINKRRYDVVLADYHMPTLNGLQFIEMCRVMRPETPTILMSVDVFVTNRSNLVKGGTIQMVSRCTQSRLIELVNQACCSLPQSGVFKLPHDGRKTDPRSSPLNGHDTSLQATKAVPLSN